MLEAIGAAKLPEDTQIGESRAFDPCVIDGVEIDESVQQFTAGIRLRHPICNLAENGIFVTIRVVEARSIDEDKSRAIDDASIRGDAFGS